MAPGSSAENDTDRRIAQLESTLAHLQYTYDALNGVVIEQAKTIELLQRRLQQLESSLEDVREQLPSEPRDPLAEKPPHY